MVLGNDFTPAFKGPRRWNKNFRIGSADLPVLNPSYSMQGEDLVVRNLLRKELTSGKIGFYADIGAYAPRYGSNTYLFHQYGWRGVCVEPNPKMAEAFAQERPDGLLITAAAGPDGKGYWSESKLDAASSRVAQDAASFDDDFHPPVEIPFIAMKTLFEQHAPADGGVDYLSLDVEGFELEVLQTNDWSRFKPTVIVIEESTLDITNIFAAPALAYLRDQGYRARAVLPPNVILTAT